MKVLHLLNHAGQGGTEQYIRTLILAMEQNGVEAELAYHEYGPLTQWAQERSLPVHHLEMNSPFDRAAVAALAKLCRERKIDVVHTHYLRENYIALQAKRKVSGLRVIYTYHILTENSSVQKICNRILSQWQDAAVANCSAGAARLAENGVPQRKIRLVYNAVDPECWQTENSTLREELGLGNDVFLFLYAARLVEGKGHVWLLESIKELQECTERPFCLVLAGDGPLKNELEKTVEELDLTNVVTFLGYRSDMSNLYHGADLTLCPSESETLSLLLLESLACGTPALGTNVGGIPDILSPEHDCGAMIPYGDTETLANTLAEIMEDETKRRRWSTNGPRVIEEKFSTRSQCRQMLALYQGKEAEQ